MTKEKVRDYIDSFLQQHIEELRKELDHKVKSSVIQCSDINDIDSHSHQFQTLKDEKNINDRLDQIIKDRNRFHKISMLQSDKVKEGVLIEVKNIYIYVGVVTPIISNNEKDVIGISTSAPIYKTLENQNVGFKFKFNGSDCIIESIS